MISLFGLHVRLHPMLVHFPVALFMGALALEVLSRVFKKENLHQSAFHVCLLAVAIIPFVVLTGLEEANEWHLVNHPVFNLHRAFALSSLVMALIIFPVVWLMRHKKITAYRTIFLLFLISIVSSISIAAYNGGRLVYEYGIGVEK